MANGKSRLSNRFAGYKRKAKPTRRVSRAVPVRRVVRIAKAVIKRNTETKLIRYNATQTLYNATGDMASFYGTTGNVICLSPHGSYNSIAQGVTDSTRIGNSVNTHRCYLKLNIIPNAYNATYNPTPIPMYIKIWIFSLRYDNEVSAMQSIVNANFMDANASSTGLTSSLTDLTGTVNKNVLTLKKVLIRKVGYADVTGTGSQAGVQYVANNDYKLTALVMLDVTKYLKKTYRYNDSSSTTPYDQHTWCIVEPIAYNNDTTMLGVRPATMMYTLEYQYKDA